jgi:hypothetical protein
VTRAEPEALYAWQEFGADKQWGTIASIIPAISDKPVPLVFRDLETARKHRVLVEGHEAVSGNEVKLRRFLLDPAFVENAW